MKTMKLKEIKQPAKYLTSTTQEQVKKLDKIFIEGVLNTSNRKILEKYGGVVESYMAVKEAINTTGDDADLYSTLMAQFIDEAFEPNLIAREVIQTVNFPFNGYDSIKIPRDNQLTAVEVNTDGTFPSEATEGFDSVTANIKFVGGYTYIPEQLRRKSAVDLLAYRFQQLARAINRKVDSDILAEVEKATTAGDADYGTNDNEVEGAVTYDNMIDLLEKLYSNDAEDTDLLINPKAWASLNKTADAKSAANFISRITQGAEGSVTLLHGFGKSRLHITSQMPDDTVYAVDRNRSMAFVDGGDIQMFDGRVSGTVQHETLAIKPYAVKIVNPKAFAALRPSA